MEINEIIIRKTDEFREKLAVKTIPEKNLFHYNSILNISSRIILHNDSKAKSLKEIWIKFFDEIDERNYIIEQKLESSKIHNIYILPLEQYLIRKEQFVTNSDIHLLVISGIILDFILFYFLDQYYYPIFILLFLVLGLYRRKQAKINGKYAAMFW
ncbi:MAG: hypothetical protein CVU03_06275 [Bacteroidetes bacterium HGW-Bacteroidetes-2]|jgi:F0F1-type ATP synthase assembly protein I|nr:MAG: hypothetical protein CVU03_06275 [Bacteroidetes bacterium HGW-Bacteroidetes-2]